MKAEDISIGIIVIFGIWMFVKLVKDHLNFRKEYEKLNIDFFLEEKRIYELEKRLNKLCTKCDKPKYKDDLCKDHWNEINC